MINNETFSLQFARSRFFAAKIYKVCKASFQEKYFTPGTYVLFILTLCFLFVKKNVEVSKMACLIYMHEA